MKQNGSQVLFLSAPDDACLSFAQQGFFAPELQTLQRNMQGYMSREQLPLTAVLVISDGRESIAVRGRSNIVILDVTDPLRTVVNWSQNWQPDLWVCTNAFDYAALVKQGIDNAVCTPLLRHLELTPPPHKQGWLVESFSIWIEGLNSAHDYQLLYNVIERLQALVPELTLCIPKTENFAVDRSSFPCTTYIVAKQDWSLAAECHLALYLPDSFNRWQLSPTETLFQQLPILIPASGGFIDFAGKHACVYGGNDSHAIEDQIVQWLLRLHDNQQYQSYAADIRKFIEQSLSESCYKQLKALITGWRPDEQLKGLWLFGTALQAQQARLYELGINLYKRLLGSPAHRISSLMNMGNMHLDAGYYAKALQCFQCLLEFHPHHSGALLALGNTLRRMGAFEQANVTLELATQVEPSAINHWNLAFSYLCEGRYREAWPHFEHRHEALKLRQVTPEQAERWNPKIHKAGHLLILDEQGIGDTLQFLRFIEQLCERTQFKISFAGKASVLPIVRQLLPAHRVYDWNNPSTLPTFDYWVPLMSLPMHFGIQSPDDLPLPIKAPATLVSSEALCKWQDSVTNDDRARVALCWRGNPNFKADRNRSPGLKPLLPLLKVKGAQFVSLQISPVAIEELDAAKVEHQIQNLGRLILSENGNLMDTFALLTQCDYVITSCTSMAHMAGVLGLPTLVLLPQNSDWRWLNSREDSPWYPSLTLVRQQQIGQWSDSVEQAKQHLERFLDLRNS